MAKFRLGSLLRYNESIGDREKIALSAALKDVQTCRQLISELEKEVKNSNRLLEQQWHGAKPDIMMIRVQHQYLYNLEEQILQANSKLSELQKIASQKRENLLKAKIKIKTIELLKKKSIAEELKLLQKKELNVFNEMAANRYIASQDD